MRSGTTTGAGHGLDDLNKDREEPQADFKPSTKPSKRHATKC